MWMKIEFSKTRDGSLRACCCIIIVIQCVGLRNRTDLSSITVPFRTDHADWLISIWIQNEKTAFHRRQTLLWNEKKVIFESMHAVSGDIYYYIG